MLFGLIKFFAAVGSSIAVVWPVPNSSGASTNDVSERICKKIFPGVVYI